MGKLTYEEVLDKIGNQRRFGTLPGVEVTARILERLGNPQRGIPMIHIAGTNGKGSVSAFLCAILQQAGLKTGMFTSPHLVDFRERIQVNGAMIAKEDVARLGDCLLSERYEAAPSMFDYCLGMALLYFREQNCDVMILETGLGGRLDSTNAVGIPVVTVITKIGYDHMEILGNTLAEIAAEKAGIIKKGTHLVVESQEREVMEVFAAAARKAEVKTYQVVDCSEITGTAYLGKEQEFSYHGYRNLRMRLPGSHQYENAAAAILAAEAFLQETNTAFGEAVIREGIRTAAWPGRMECLSEHPGFWVDGAHNSNGAAALAESLRQMFPGEKFHFVMGVMADKEYEKMLEDILPLAVDVKTANVGDSRGLQAETLAECIRKKGVPAEAVSKIEDAVLPAALAEDFPTVAFGSLYFIGEVKEIWQTQKASV